MTEQGNCKNTIEIQNKPKKCRIKQLQKYGGNKNAAINEENSLYEETI